MRRVGEGRPHALIDIDQGVDKHQRLEPVEPAYLDWRQPGPAVVGATQKSDGQNDETEHEPYVARLEARAEHEPETGHCNTRDGDEGDDDAPMQR